MRRIEGERFEDIRRYFIQAGKVAERATCLRARCGSVIECDGAVIGQGFNGPALGEESARMCGASFDTTLRPKYDKTCCVHAEWRAIIEACKARPEDVTRATLYFMRVDDDGRFTDAGDPFCTVCSRLAMEAGIAAFALYNDNGADIYALSEYNAKSYAPYLPAAS